MVSNNPEDAKQVLYSNNDHITAVLSSFRKRLPSLTPDRQAEYFASLDNGKQHRS